MITKIVPDASCILVWYSAWCLHNIFTHLYNMCIKSSYIPCAYLAYNNSKDAPDAHYTYMLVCIISALGLHKSAQCVHQVCIFTTMPFFSAKRHSGMQTMCRQRAHFAHFKQTWYRVYYRLSHQKCTSGTRCTLGPSVQVCKISGIHTLLTFPWCAKSA